MPKVRAKKATDAAVVIEADKNDEQQDSKSAGNDEQTAINSGTTGLALEAVRLASQTKLQPMDWDNIKLDSLMCEVGKRRFGKSIHARYLLSKLWPFFPDGGYVFTGTKVNGYWDQHFPEERIYLGMRMDIIEQIIAKQSAKRERMKELGPAYRDCPYIIMVFDDVVDDQKGMRYTEEIRRLAFMGRHYFVFVLFCTQDAMALSPMIRSNCDIVAVTYQVQQRQVEAIRENWADFFPNKHFFGELLKQNTRDFGMLIINQSDAIYDWTEALFVDRAELEPAPFRIGDSKFWKESGCSWEEQVRIWTDTPRPEKTDLAEINIERWEKSQADEEEDKRQSLLKQEAKLATNNPAFAPDDEALQERPKSITAKVWEKRHEHDYVKYIPGAKVKNPWD